MNYQQTINPRPVTSAGFTLIEIMVVVAIIGTMAAILTFNMQRDTDRLARLESQRFMAIVNEVRDESIIVGEAFILSLNDKSRTYSFNGTRDGGSLGDGLLRTRSIEEGVKLDWEVLAEFDDEDDTDREPQVWISPLGEITPFDVRFGGEELDYHVFVNDDNEIERRSENARLF